MHTPINTHSTQRQHAASAPIVTFTRPRRRNSHHRKMPLTPCQPGVDLARILSVAAELNRNAASRCGVQIRCCALDQHIYGAEFRGLLRRVAILLRRAIQNASGSSIVTCQIGQSATSIKAHIRYARSQPLPHTGDGCNWIDEFWTWPAGADNGRNARKHWQFAA